MTGLRACRHLTCPAGKDKLAGRAPIESSGTHIPTRAVFHTATPAPTQILAPALAFAPAQGLLGNYTNINLQRATKLALELFI